MAQNIFCLEKVAHGKISSTTTLTLIRGWASILHEGPN